MTDYKWCAIDAEGDVGNRGLLGVAFYSDICGEYLTDHQAIKDTLLAFAQDGYTFLAHNAQYDLSVVFYQLHIPMKAVYCNGRFLKGEWRYARRHKLAELWDTYALSGCISLEQLGTTLGIPKYSTPQRLLGYDPNRYHWTCETHKRGECESCYALRDAEITYRFITELTATLGAWGVEPHNRLSGLALRVWQTLDTPAPVALRNRRVETLARRAYHGGRCETYKLGHFNQVFTADVQSMYPSVMLDSPFPDPAQMVHQVRPMLCHVPWQAEGVAECDVDVPAMYVPPLPCSDKGVLHYPIGRLHGCWTLAELRYAMSLGCTVRAVHQLAYSPATLAPFTQFVGTLWAMREAFEAKGDSRAFFAKLLMNSLYGRLGMESAMERRIIWQLERGRSFKSQKKDVWYTEEGELYLERRYRTYAKPTWTNVLWAAQITSYARIRLHAHLLAQGSGLVYTDTDSIVSLSPIIGASYGLGQLRETGSYQAATVVAPKLYGLQDQLGLWHVKAKGLPAGAGHDFLIYGVASYQAPVTPSQQHRKGIKAGTWIDMRKENHYAPARRQPTDPNALIQGVGWSDTSPTWFGPEGE